MRSADAVARAAQIVECAKKNPEMTSQQLAERFRLNRNAVNKILKRNNLKASVTDGPNELEAPGGLLKKTIQKYRKPRVA